jgi:hypothetical protein
MSGLLNLTIESGSAPLSVGNMTFKNGVELNSIAPLTIGDQASKGWNGQLRVESIKVKYNKAQDCLANFGKADVLVVRNSLFVDNQANTSVVAVKGKTVVFTGNTVASNDVPSALFSQAVYMSGDDREFIANNIIANNIALDLGIYANQGVADLQNNDIGAFFAPPWVVVKQNSNITVQPTFMAKQDYRLVPGSQQIDTGAQGLDPGMFDVDGAPRVQGIVDIGAYERKNATP